MNLPPALSPGAVRWAGLAVILLFAGSLVGSTFKQVQYEATADEGYYLRYATRIAQGGLGEFPALFRDYLEDSSSSQYYPPPNRLTTILLGSAALKLRGAVYRSLSELSLAAFLGLLCLIFVGVNRSFGEKAALWTTLLLAVSPLGLGMARRALSDSLTAFFFIASFWMLFRNLSSGGTSRRWWILSLLYTAAFLTKESALLLIPVSLSYLLWQSLRKERELTLLPVLAVSVIPLLLAFALTAWAAGSPATAWKVEQLFAASARFSRYGQQFDQGPWFLYLVDLILFSPWVAFLYIGWVAHLAAGRERDFQVWILALLPLLFVAFTSFLPARNIRHLLLIEAPVRLGAVLFLQKLVGDGTGSKRAGPPQSRRAGLAMALAVLGISFLDLAAFREVFLELRFYDPVSFWLLYWRGFLPR